LRGETFARLLLRAEGAEGVGSGGVSLVIREPHKSVFPSLIEKNFGRGARKRNEWKNAFVCSRRQAVHRRWAGSVREIREISLKHCSNFVQETPPNFTFGRIGRLRFAAKPLGAPFCCKNKRIFQTDCERALANAGVRRAKRGQNESFVTNLFPSAFGGSKTIFSFRLSKHI